MVKEYIIRGSEETVFFAEINLDRSSIYKLEFHQKSQKRITKTHVYELNSRLVAMERDGEMASFINNKPSIFLFGED